MADSALRDGLATGLTRDDLVAAAESLPRTGRRRALDVVALADRRAANAFESVTRAIVLPIAGLSVTPQGDLGFSEAGAEQYGDLVDTRLKLLIECESWAYHAGEEPFRRDIQGQALGLQGQGMMIGQAVGAGVGGAIATYLVPGHAMGLLATASLLVTVGLTPGLRRSAPASLGR